METRNIIGIISRIRERANALIEHELRERNIKGIVPAHGSILSFLYGQQNPVPIKSVVERVGRVKSTVTGMIQILERHGYIHKYSCQSDCRVTFVELTKKARNLQKDFEEISQIVLERLYGGMPVSDRERIVEQLKQFETNLSG